MNGKYLYAPEIMSLSSCIKVIPQYCTAMNDVNVCNGLLYKHSYLIYFLLDNIGVQIIPLK